MTTPATETIVVAESTDPVAVTPAATVETPKPAEAKPETDWKAEARKHEQRAKENAAKAKQFDELLESQKTEQQKLADRAEAAEKRAAELESAALRDRIAREHNLPAELAARLVGADADALEADAKALQALLKPAAAPAADIDQGAKGGGVTAPAQLTQADLVKMTPAQIVKAKAEGRCNDLLGIK